MKKISRIVHVNPCEDVFECEKVVFCVRNGGLFVKGEIVREADRLIDEIDDLFLREIAMPDEDGNMPEMVPVIISDADLEKAKDFLVKHWFAYAEEWMIHNSRPIKDEELQAWFNSFHLIETFLKEEVLFVAEEISQVPFVDEIRRMVASSSFKSFVSHMDTVGYEALYDLQRRIRKQLLMRVYTPTRAEREHGIQSGTVRKAIEREDLQAVYADQRTLIIEREDLEEVWPMKFKTTDNKVRLPITTGGFNHNYVKVTGVESFFPKNAFGYGSRDSGEGDRLTLQLEGFNDYVETDIDGAKNIFRWRRWHSFFEMHGLKVGDFIEIERVSTFWYRVRPIKRWEI